MRLHRNIFALAALTLGCVAAAQAPSVRAEGSRVVVNEVPVLAFRTSHEGAAPETRASLLAARLLSARGAVTVEGKQRVRKLFRGKELLTVVTPQEAAANGSGLGSLARSWAASLNQALALPALKLSETIVRLPLGETRQVKLVGSRAAAADVLPSDARVVAATRAPGVLTLKGLGAGQASVAVSAGSATQSISVEVWPYAANLPQEVNANVTGLPTDANTVRGAIDGALRTQLKTAPNAQWTYTTPTVGDLEIGGARSYNVRVKVEAPRSFSREGTVRVNVRNLPVAKRTEGELWYCNDPESLKRPGPLFSSPLLREAPVRLLYHHVNDSTYPLFVRIQAVNDTDKPARVALVPGDSKPDRNPVLAGLLAADQFMRSWVTGSGEVITIPPRSTLPLSLRRLGPGDTMSGLCALRLLPGGPDSLLVRADAIPPFDTDARWTAALSSPAPWRVVGTPPVSHYDQAPTVASTHIYPNPYKQEEVSYQVGGRYGFVRIGQRPISSADKVRALDGNFGVLYTIKASATNPTDQPADVEVVFEASAGYAGALFLVNGELKRTHPLPPKSETQLARFQLEPGESRSLTLVTVPHSGGSYPATVTIRPVRDATAYSGPRATK